MLAGGTYNVTSLGRFWSFNTTLAAVTIEAQNGTGAVVLDARGSGGIFEVPLNASLRLVGLTLAGGASSGDGGAVLLLGGALSVRGCHFVRNSAAVNGGAVAMRGGFASIDATTFSDNSALASGGAVDVRGGASFEVTASHFVRNSAGEHGTALNYEPDAAAGGIIGAQRPTLDANFSGNVGASPLRYLAPVSLRCRLGQWAPALLHGNTSISDFDGCPHSCARAYIGLFVNHTGAECGGECPAGYYCEQGFSAKCPVGTANPIPGAGRTQACQSCSPGTFQAEEGSTACSACAAGSFEPDVGATACATSACRAGYFCPHHNHSGSTSNARTALVACPAGRWSNLTGRASSSACQLCPELHFCVEGATQPARCPRGTLGGASGLTSYECAGPCPAGSWCSEGTAIVTECEAGRYNPLRGRWNGSACLEATLGHYAGRGAASLHECPAGRYGSSTGLSSSECTALCPQDHYCTAGSIRAYVCPEGTYGAQSGLTNREACTRCPPGFYCISGRRFSCRTGSYNEQAGGGAQISCTPCPALSSSRVAANSSSDCKCPIDFFAAHLLRANTSARAAQSSHAGFECQRAPAGTNCSTPGTELLVLPLREGYWRISKEAADVRRCPDADLGNSSACAGGTGEASGPTGAYCREGLHGIFCSECVDELMYFSTIDSQCYSCDSLEGRSGVHFAVGILVGLLCVATIIALIQVRPRSVRCVLSAPIEQ